MNGKKCLTVFNQKLAASLMQAGHKLIGMERDNKYPERNVFFFLNTAAVRSDMEKYKKKNK